MKWLKKLDGNITDLYNDKGWIGIVFRLFLFYLFYMTVYWLPQIYSRITGKKISDFVTQERHHFYMILANGMAVGVIFIAGIRAVQLIKHKDWYIQQRKNKKLADERLEQEIVERKHAKK